MSPAHALRWRAWIVGIIAAGAVALATPAARAATADLPTSGGRIVYLEDFEKNSGGWMTDKFRPLQVNEGIAYCYGDPARGPVYAPWSVDFWHAPPGGGYLYMLLWLHTHRDRVPAAGYYPGYPGNRFTAEGYPTDFRNAEVTVRLRGDIELRGAELHFWAQSTDGEVTPNYLFLPPIKVTSEWSEQSFTLSPDPKLWRCMGGRHDRSDYADGCRIPIDRVLEDLNVDMIFVLYPLNIVPTEPVEDMHRLRAEAEYKVDYEKLPKGVIEFDWVRVAFAPGVGQ